MQVKLSKRMTKPDFPSEFLASILKANADPTIITFAGGLPNALSFPVEAMDAAADKVLKENGIMALQYSGAQGYLPLRKFIAERYKKQNIDVDPSEIIITNGSQQALDMFSAVMIDPGDRVLVENPSYLAALQTFHLYDPEVVPIELHEDGIDVRQLETAIREKKPQFMYLIPNFQNPTGLTYSEEVREKAAAVFRNSDVIVLEVRLVFGRAVLPAGYFLENCLAGHACGLDRLQAERDPGQDAHLQGHHGSSYQHVRSDGPVSVFEGQ